MALRHLVKPVSRVIRDGNVAEIDVGNLVPGDLVTLNPGDKIPADGDLLEAINLTINEAILTGESEPVPRYIGNRVFMGTIVLSGRGLFQIASTGIRTELGKIADSLIKIKDEPTPLQVRLSAFGKTLTYLVVIISIFIFLSGILFKSDFSLAGILAMSRLSVVLAIAAIPEGLLIAVTIILVIGMRAILRCKGLVKKLVAVETLGSVTGDLHGQNGHVNRRKYAGRAHGISGS